MTSQCTPPKRKPPNNYFFFSEPLFLSNLGFFLSFLALLRFSYTSDSLLLSRERWEVEGKKNGGGWTAHAWSNLGASRAPKFEFWNRSMGQVVHDSRKGKPPQKQTNRKSENAHGNYSNLNISKSHNNNKKNTCTFLIALFGINCTWCKMVDFL